MTEVVSRREENRLARRAAIVAAARDSFLDNGYAATSMSTIAAQLGGSKGTLWAYFPSKEALFAAVLDDLTAAFRRELDEAFRPGRSLRAALQFFCESFMCKVMAPHAIKLHRLIIAEGDRFPEIGPLFYERGPKPVTDHLTSYLGKQMDKGLLRRADPAMAAAHLTDLIKGPQASRLWGVEQRCTADDIRIHAASVVELFLRGYAPER
jgi:AcrR family transcriptional regulator